MSGGHVEGIDQPLKRAEPDDLVNVDVSGEGEDGQRQRLKHGQNLGHHQNLASIEAVNPNPGERGEQKGWNLPGEADDSEQKRGTGQPVHQPARGQTRHPCADQRDSLAAEI